MTKTKFQKYEAVEVKGMWLGSYFQWWSGYYILEVEDDDNYLISSTYKGDHNITQLTFPTRAHADRLRKPDNPPKLSVTGGIYSGDNFLQQSGASMVRAFYREEEAWLT
jgi:hypothetical protein